MSVMPHDLPFGSTDPPLPRIDLAAMQSAVEKAAEWDGDGPSEAELIDELARVQRLKSSLEALQASLARAFGRRHVASQTASGRVEPDRLERSVVAQVASACRTSPYQGRKLVVLGRDLRNGLDHVRALFVAGDIGATKAAAVVAATADLDAGERARVDAVLAGHDLAGMGTQQIRDLARYAAAQVVPEKFRARAETARKARRVTLRPGEDGMTWLTAHLPVEQGVACAAALERAYRRVQVDPAPLTRTRGQVMADTLVERITGQTTAEHVNVEVQVVVPVNALIDPSSPLPAEIPGHGPIPMSALASMRGRKRWRRLLTSDGIVIGGDSKRRAFPGFLDMLIRARDRHRCSEPYCDAPIRQIDHIVRVEDGGETDFLQGRGVCEFHNYVRELPGWAVERTDEGVETTTPTGHRYLSRPARR